eukprot:13273149-Alexandrium_andersonii.AAC.1
MRGAKTRDRENPAGTPFACRRRISARRSQACDSDPSPGRRRMRSCSLRAARRSSPAGPGSARRGWHRGART